MNFRLHFKTNSLTQKAVPGREGAHYNRILRIS